MMCGWRTLPLYRTIRVTLMPQLGAPIKLAIHGVDIWGSKGLRKGRGRGASFQGTRSRKGMGGRKAAPCARNLGTNRGVVVEAVVDRAGRARPSAEKRGAAARELARVTLSATRYPTVLSRRPSAEEGSGPKAAERRIRSAAGARVRRPRARAGAACRSTARRLAAAPAARGRQPIREPDEHPATGRRFRRRSASRTR